MGDKAWFIHIHNTFKVVEWLRTLKPTESSDTLQVKILRQIAKAYAQLCEELETQKSTLPKVSVFVQDLPLNIFPQLVDNLNRILEDKGYQRDGEKKLTKFLGWVVGHADARDDVVSVATVGHIGLVL